MSWEAISAVGEVTGALAVIVSIIYLAIQVKQNTNSTRSSVEQTSANHMSALLAQISATSVPSIVVRASHNLSNLTDDELAQYGYWMAAVFRTFEHSYYQYRLGNLSEQTWGAVDATVKSQLNSDGAKKLWRLRAETYDAEFRRYVDSVVEVSDTIGANELLASLRDNDTK